jgi:hypothetical protein
MKNKKRKKAPRRFPEIRWEGKEDEGKKKNKLVSAQLGSIST